MTSERAAQRAAKAHSCTGRRRLDVHLCEDLLVQSSTACSLGLNPSSMEQELGEVISPIQAGACL